MAAHPDRVRAFYDDIVPAVSDAADREAAAMQSLLERDGEAGAIGIWDWRFYDFCQRRDDYGVDAALVSEHLPLDRVLDGLFSITADVFGLRYRRVEGAAPGIRRSSSTRSAMPPVTSCSPISTRTSSRGRTSTAMLPPSRWWWVTAGPVAPTSDP